MPDTSSRLVVAVRVVRLSVCTSLRCRIIRTGVPCCSVNGSFCTPCGSGDAPCVRDNVAQYQRPGRCSHAAPRTRRICSDTYASAHAASDSIKDARLRDSFGGERLTQVCASKVLHQAASLVRLKGTPDWPALCASEQTRSGFGSIGATAPTPARFKVFIAILLERWWVPPRSCAAIIKSLASPRWRLWARCGLSIISSA
jgi:hypothetical protein